MPKYTASLQLRSWRYLLAVVALALSYALLTKLVFLIPFKGLDGRIWPLWLPAGFAQAMLLMGGRQLWAGIAIGSLLFSLHSGFLWGGAIVFACINTLQPVLGLSLLRSTRFQTSLRSVKNVLELLLFAGVFPAFASATFGILYLALVGRIPWANFQSAWFDWWIGNVTGVLTFMPVLLTYRQWGAIVRRPLQVLEAIFWLALLIAISWLVFCSTTRMIHAPYPLEYLPFPFVIWGSLRFGLPGATLATALVTNIATWGVARGISPFLPNTDNFSEAVLSLQAYICVIALTALIFAAMMAEREEARISLQIEKDKSEQLLLNILPEPIADRLKQEQRTIADSFAEVTVLFADIADFTKISATLSPQALVALLNEIFSEFDHLAERHGLEKIKTIGDAYMVVGGLPYPDPNHAQAVAEMAIDMQAALKQFSQRQKKPFRMRIGINTGPVVAGVIGTKKFIYDLWGDTVNIASRMESQGVIDQIQVSTNTYSQLHHLYEFQERGEIVIKGGGKMVTYLLMGRKTTRGAIDEGDAPDAKPSHFIDPQFDVI
jgi:class 3 adenylate cyclase/integral membrane sensor domain MASE1